MDAAIVIILSLAILLGIVVLVALVQRARRRQRENRREQAHEYRQEADVRAARADRREAEAQERIGRANREQAMAREEGAHAARDREAAQEGREHADRLDPGAGSRQGTPAGDRGRAVPGGGSPDIGNGTAAPVRHGAPEVRERRRHEDDTDLVNPEHGGGAARDPGWQGIDPGPAGDSRAERLP